MIVNGTTYPDGTSQAVVNCLEAARTSGQKIRVFYGENGRDWLEEHDTLGTVGRSMGSEKIPLLIKSPISYGGGAILVNSIVRIQANDKQYGIRDLYKDPNYSRPVLSIRTGNPLMSYPVFADDEHVATFDTCEKAERWIKFMRGERWSK